MNKQKTTGLIMYGLAEYALLRQQLNESKIREKHHAEFDFPITQPARRKRIYRLNNVVNYLPARSSIKSLFRLGRKAK